MTNWPGQEIGIRAPMLDETPLSWEEVQTLIPKEKDATMATNPKIITACEHVERNGRAVAADIASAMGFALSTACIWLSDAEKLGMLALEPGSRPRRYTVAPNWRLRIEGRPTPEKTRTEWACEIVESLGVALAGQVGKKMGTDSNAAAGVLSAGVRKGWLKREERGLRNVYAVTQAWCAHVAGDERFQAHSVPAQSNCSDDLRIDYTVPPLPPTPRGYWAGLELYGKGARA